MNIVTLIGLLLDSVSDQARKRPVLHCKSLVNNVPISRKARFLKKCKEKYLRRSRRICCCRMAAILRSGKFLRLFSGVARYIYKTENNQSHLLISSL